MKFTLKPLALAALMLSACVSLPPPAPIPVPAAAPPTTPSPDIPACSLAAGLSQFSAPNTGSTCASDRLLNLAQQMMNNHSDINRVQGQLDALLAQDLDSANRSFALILASQLNERKRLNGLLDKQIAATKEQQKRANDLAAKLDALKEMEKELLARGKKP
ncbi:MULTISPECIES: hypothetical protein [unclassified Iodobacter]|uniref:hypothetical protein n=1 Tax=unclassified Iodobacter TaxID=235634 RepID=UPI0025F6B150|nr:MULTISPECIES: hypothetical protein [unclassified Iodobacter]MDW5418783.1 hypothetical protein [Iodobacter sp. CM08]